MEAEGGQWVKRDDEDAVYLGRIGKGGYGEIHQVRRMNLLNLMVSCAM
jgi:hypothetical protein